MSWRDGKTWSDQFLPEIKAILGVNLMCEPVASEDQERNTDLIVLNMQSYRIACRVRRNKEWFKPGYRGQFTIRWKYNNGSRTEIDKIRDGWGDYMVYAFAEESAPRLYQWAIIDLGVFRSNEVFVDPDTFPNADGRNWLAAYKYIDFPKELVCAFGGTMYRNDLFVSTGSPRASMAGLRSVLA